MKLTKRGEYGLKALIDLAGQADPQAATQIKDIAKRQQIPVKFLEHDRVWRDRGVSSDPSDFT